MINLLPYEKRLKLKSLYKEKLTVVALLAVGVALCPLILVIMVITYAEYSNINTLGMQYAKMQEMRHSQGIDGLAGRVKEINRTIGTFQGSMREAKKISPAILSAISLRSPDLRITGLEFDMEAKSERLSLRGVARNREALIAYVAALSNQDSGICKSVQVPVTTYAKKVDIPFNISCILKNDSN